MTDLLDIGTNAVNKALRSLYDAGWLEVNDDKEITLTEKYDVRKPASSTEKNSVDAENFSVPHAGVPCSEDQIANKSPVSDDTNTNPQATRERNKANTISADKTRQLLMGYEEAEKTALPKDEARARIKAMRDQLKRQP